MNKGFLTGIFFLISLTTMGQFTKDIGLIHNYVLSFHTGPSMVLTEYQRDFSGFINEMNHRPGISASAGLSKIFLKRWKVGYEYELSFFRGFQDNPDFSAYRLGHYKISLMQIEPVIYRTRLTNQNLTLTYSFTGNKEHRIIPFIFIKGGISKIMSELKYKANHEVIFSKTGRDENKPNSSIYVDNFNFGAGAGAEYVINTKLSLNIMAMVNMVNDDNLDAVHNFKVPPPEGYKNYISGLYGKMEIGISYYINPDRQQVASRKFLLKDTFNNKRRRKKSFLWYKF